MKTDTKQVPYNFHSVIIEQFKGSKRTGFLDVDTVKVGDKGSYIADYPEFRMVDQIDKPNHLVWLAKGGIRECDLDTPKFHNKFFVIVEVNDYFGRVRAVYQHDSKFQLYEAYKNT